MKANDRYTTLALTLTAIGLLGVIATTLGIWPALGAFGLLCAIKAGVS